MSYDVSMFFDEPSETYHAQACDNLSSHQLIDFDKSPLLYISKRTSAKCKCSSAAFAVGEAAHCLFLEGQNAFLERFCTTDGAPRNPKTGEVYGATSKAYQEWAASQKKKILAPSQEALVREIAYSASTHEVARQYVSVGAPEQVFRGKFCDVDCQIRIDWLNPDGYIVDYKTCDSLEFFERDASRYGYFIQAAFYRALTRVATNETFEFKIIATEKQEPFATGVFSVVGLDAEEERVERLIREMSKCYQEGTFPSGYEKERYLSCQR